MSIGKRLIDMARSELNSLLDAASKHAGDDDEDGNQEAARGPDPGRSAGVPGSSAWQDEAEWHRRAQQEVEDAIHGRKTPEPPPRASSRSSGRTSSSATPSEAQRVQQAYVTLEVAAGADFETVRRSYRALMRKYHPDHHTQSPEKQRAANARAQKLTEAYKLLEKRLRK